LSDDSSPTPPPATSVALIVGSVVGGLAGASVVGIAVYVWYTRVFARVSPPVAVAAQAYTVAGTRTPVHAYNVQMVQV